jgi:hypothetical protein
MESLEAVSLTRRLDYLERAHRRLKRAVAGGLIALAAVGVMGQAAVTRLKTVEADWLMIRNGLMIRDAASSSVRASFDLKGWRVFNSNSAPAYVDVSDGATEFSLGDSVGKQRVVFFVDKGASFALSDSTGRNRVQSLVTPDNQGTQITLSDSAGTSRARLSEGNGFSPSLTLHDSAGKLRASLTPEGLTLFDEAGRTRAVLGETDLEVTTTGTVEHRQSSSLVLFDRNGKVLWKSP